MIERKPFRAMIQTADVLGEKRTLRIVAARFRDRRGATAAKEKLQRLLGIDPKQVEIAPLGDPESPQDEGATLLAGRIGDDQSDPAAEVMRREGGDVVVNVDESLTRPRMTAHRAGWHP